MSRGKVLGSDTSRLACFAKTYLKCRNCVNYSNLVVPLITNSTGGSGICQEVRIDNELTLFDFKLARFDYKLARFDYKLTRLDSYCGSN